MDTSNKKVRAKRIYNRVMSIILTFAMMLSAFAGIASTVLINAPEAEAATTSSQSVSWSPFGVYGSLTTKTTFDAGSNSSSSPLVIDPSGSGSVTVTITGLKRSWSGTSTAISTGGVSASIAVSGIQVSTSGGDYFSLSSSAGGISKDTGTATLTLTAAKTAQPNSPTVQAGTVTITVYYDCYATMRNTSNGTLMDSASSSASKTFTFNYYVKVFPSFYIDFYKHCYDASVSSNPTHHCSSLGRVWASNSGNITLKGTYSTTLNSGSTATSNGWTTSHSASVNHARQYNPSATITITKNMTLYTSYASGGGGAATTYTVTFNANGGTGAPANQTKTHDVNLTLSSTKPTRAGYTFTGWNTTSAGTGTAYASGSTYTANANLTLYAQWKTNTYTVAYNANGGSGAPANQTKTHDVNLTLSSTKPTRTGYTFTGWNTASGGTGTAYASGGTYTANANLTLYAQWSPINYIVKFDGNGSTSGSMTDQSFEYDVQQNLAANTFSKTGNTFLGWSTNKSATTAAYANEQSVVNLTATDGSTVTLYALWTPITYDVIYDANGGVNAPTTQSKIEDIPLTLASDSPSREGYTFTGWNTKADGTGADYILGDTYTDNAKLVLYAQWTPTIYKLIYDSNGGTGAPASQTGAYSSNLTISETVPTRTGYTFLGWGTTSTATTATYNAGDKFTVPASDTTIYAVWKLNTFAVKYDANGGENAPAAQIKSYGVDLTLSTDKPIRTGYTFAGWNTVANGGGTDFASGDKYIDNADLTLYAQWKLNDYTITYYVDNEEHKVETYAYGAKVTTREEPTKVGYTFSGWSTIPATMPAENIEVYGTFDVNEYTITFDTVGGTPVPDITLDYGSDVPDVDEPSKEGHTFDGWDTPIPDTMPAEDITITAKWLLNTYTVNYDANEGESAPAAQIKSYGVDLTLSTNKPVRVGYTFVSWNTMRDGSGISYTAGGAYTDNTGITLYAQWTPIKYEVAYHANGKNVIGAIANSSHDFDIPKTLSKNEFTRNGYIFKGWGVSENATSIVYTDQQLVTNLTDKDGDVVNLYALWQAVVYDIDYVLNGGVNNESNPETYTPDDAFMFEPATYEHYDFDGWYLDNDTFTQQIEGVELGSVGDIEVYAKWTPTVNDITYILNDGINDQSNPNEMTYFDVAPILPATREHYIFDGWFDENGNKVEELKELTGPVTLTAKWTPIEYKITYILNGGYILDGMPTTYTVEDDFKIRAAYHYGDYVFRWWKDEDGNRVDRLAGEYARDITLSAFFSYYEGAGNIVATGEISESTAVLLAGAGLIAVTAIAGPIILAVKRKNKNNEEE